MGTKVHCENYLPGGYHSMREFNQDSGKSNWSMSYCDKPLSNGLYFEHLLPRAVTNSCPMDDKIVVKETMLEHDAVFKGQVSELHRLYRVQRDMMDGDRRTEIHRHPINMDTSSTSSSMAYQMPRNDAWKWHKPESPLADSVFPSPSVSGYSKGNNNTNTTASQDRFSSKVGDTLDSRPSKVRKRLFDLELPAEDYVDTEEEEHSLGHKMSDHSRHNFSFGRKMESNGAGGVKTSSYKNGSTPVYLRDSVAFGDLGKTIQVEEANRRRSVNFVDVHDLESTAKPKSHFLLGLSEKNLRRTGESYYMSSSNLDAQNDRPDRGWLPYMNDPGYNKTHYSSSQVPRSDKSHVSSRTSGNHPSECNGRDSSLDRTICDLDFLDSNLHQSSFKNQRPVAASRSLNPYLIPYVPEDSKNNLTSGQLSSLSLLGTSSRTIQSCGPNSESFKDKFYPMGGYGPSTRFECGRPNYNSFPDCSASGSKETTIRLPSVGSGSLNWIKEDKLSELSTKCGLENYSKAPNAIDVKPAIDMNLKYRADVEVGHKERKYEKCSEGLPWLKRKSNSQNESFESSLPQVASIELCKKNGAVKGQIQHFTQNSKLASHGAEVGAKRSEVDNALVNRKIFGFPMFDKPPTSNTESCRLIPPRTALPNPHNEVIKNDRGNGVFDLNVAFDPMSVEQSAKEDLPTEKECDLSVSKFKNFDLNSCVTDDEATLEPSNSGACIDNSIVAFDPKSVRGSAEEVVAEGQIGKRVVIDLNSCVTEDEVTLEPSCSSADVNVKTRFVIDLELPAAPESEEEQVLEDMAIELSLHKVPKFQDETIANAAEAIVAISSDKWNHENEAVSTQSAADEDSLLWFVDVISSYWDNSDGDFKSKSRGEDRGINMVSESSDEIDHFEVMALNLTELKEEDYMPKPLFPESLRVEETRTLSLPHQARRGRGKRGRQRKDFQRDVLPSLVSLSRQEVTRDLQTFGGMMQATGHSWNVDTTRRSRGRPRRSDVNQRVSP